MPGTNPVGTWALPNYTVDTASAYKGKIDGNAAVAERVVDLFAPHEQATPDMTVALDAGAIWDPAGSIIEVAAQSTATITAPSGNPRIDRVVIDRATGAISVVTGTEAASPSPPAIPAGKIPVAQIALSIGQIAIANTDITDERAPGHGVLLGSLAKEDSPLALNKGGTGTAAASAAAALTALGGASLTADNTLSGTQSMSGKAINEAIGTAIASAATTDIGAVAGNYVHITGTVTITGLGTVQAGTERTVVFDGALTLTHNATSLILPTGADIMTAAGDVAKFRSEGGGNWRCVGYMRADGSPLGASGVFTQSYDSGNQTITSNGTLTLAHGLSSAPKLIVTSLVCGTAEGGYSAGDEMYFGGWGVIFATAYRGASIVPDATNINVRYSASSAVFYGITKDTGQGFAATNGNWSYRVRAYA